MPGIISQMNLKSFPDMLSFDFIHTLLRPIQVNNPTKAAWIKSIPHICN